MRIRTAAITALCSLLMFSLMLPAQQTASVTGVVTDSSGGVIPGVTVTLTDTQTGAEQTATTNEIGVYLFTKIRPATGYTLRFSLSGFRTANVTDVHVGVGTTHTVNQTLQVGTPSDTIVVRSPGETINVTDATIGNVIGTRLIQDLPISIRNSPARLLGFQPGVVANTGGGSNRDGAVTGARTDQGNITLDGIDVNDQAGGFAFSVVVGAPIDTVQEFRTIAANPTATDGRSSGAQIQIVTKSGSNEWHGSARHFHRNTVTAANTFFNNKTGVERPKLLRNQFGGNLGGPILKNKLFFFFDYEGRRDAREFANTARIVPLEHLRQGSVGYINNGPGCGAASTLANNPGCITILSPSQVAGLDPRGTGANPAILALFASRYPSVNDRSAGDGVNTGGFRFNSPVGLADNLYTGRVDYNLGKHRLFGRLTIDRFRSDRTDGPLQQFPEDPVSFTSAARDYGYVIGDTWTISPTQLNQLNVGFVKQILSFDRPFRPSFPNSFTFSGISAPFTGLSVQARDVPTTTVRDDYTLQYGKHQIQSGVLFRFIRQNSQLTNDFNFIGVGLGGITTTLSAPLRPANILNSATARSQYDSAFTVALGRVASVFTRFNYDTAGVAAPPGTGKTRSFHYNEYELYLQDQWRARRDLTLTFGIRWQYYSVPFEADGLQAANDVDIKSLFDARQINALRGISGPTAEPLLRYDLAGKANDARGYYEPDLNNFAPRFSLAWSPAYNGGLGGKLFGNGKTVLRLGGSVHYDRIAGTVTFVQDQVSYLFENSTNTPFGSADPVAALRTDPRFTGVNNLPASNVAPRVTRPLTPFADADGPFGTAINATNYTLAQNFRTPYSYAYSLSLQRELPGNFLFEAAYVGRLGRKLFAQADAAQTLNFRDASSGQDLYSAFRNLQQQLIAGSAITSQPWFENQMNPASCALFGLPNCTTLVRAFLGNLVEIGDVSDVVQALFANLLLRENVGLSSQFATNAYIGNYASSNYDGMLLSLRRRFSQGLQFDFNYTLAHSIDNNSTVVNNSNNFSSLI